MTMNYIISIDEDQAAEIVAQNLVDYYSLLKSEEFIDPENSKVADAIAIVLSHYLTHDKYVNWILNRG